MEHTPTDMIVLLVRLANKLVIPARGTSGKPQNSSDVLVVKDPQRHRVTKDRMDIGSVKQTGPSIVEWYGEFVARLSAEDGEKGRVQIPLSRVSMYTCRPDRTVSTCLGCEMKPVTVAHNYALGWRRDGKVRYVRGSLSAAHDHDGFVNSELGPRFELRRVDANRNVLDPRNVRDVRGYVQACTHSNSVTLPLIFLTGCDLVRDDMARTLRNGATSNGGNPGGEVDVWPEAKIGAILVQVLEVPLGREEIGFVITSPEVRETSKLLGRYKLMVCQR